MGLGKIVQVLTAVLTRAKDAPTLVVARTSVSMNLEVEANCGTSWVAYYASGM